MPTSVGLTTRIPRGFRLVHTGENAERLELVVRPSRPSCRCPDCGAVSDSVHSRYVRKLSDLPASGRRVRLLVEARRFRCRAPSCARRVFAERFDLAALWSRRTERLNILVHHLALALGGRPGGALRRSAHGTGQQGHVASPVAPPRAPRLLAATSHWD